MMPDKKDDREAVAFFVRINGGEEWGQSSLPINSKIRRTEA